jgi:HK97 family phage major capsid protein
MTLQELLEKRARLVAEARAIYDKAESEGREPTADEQRQFDEGMADVDKLADEIKAAETEVRRKEWLEGQEALLEESRGRLSETSRADAGDTRAADQPQVIEMRGRGCQVQLPVERSAEDYMQAFRRYLAYGGAETRALQQDSDTQGGYLAPERFNAQLLMDLDDLMWMRQISNVLPPVPGHTSLGTPSLDTQPDDADWTVELGTGSEDSSMAFGKRNLATHPLAKRIKVSRTLIRASVLNVENIVRQRLTYKLNLPQEKAFLDGSGSQQPLGVFTASDDGISTSRDASTGNTTTEIRFDGLIEALYTLKAQYRRNLNWIFHRDGIKMIRKLKDGEGRYIWQASVVAGTPDTILTWPVRESEWAPNTFNTGLYVGIIGNFDYYWILDSLLMEIQVLAELYAETNQIGYIVRAETDAAPVQENAFARVTLA